MSLSFKCAVANRISSGGGNLRVCALVFRTPHPHAWKSFATQQSYLLDSQWWGLTKQAPPPLWRAKWLPSLWSTPHHWQVMVRIAGDSSSYNPSLLSLSALTSSFPQARARAKVVEHSFRWIYNMFKLAVADYEHHNVLISWVRVSLSYTF